MYARRPIGLRQKPVHIFNINFTFISRNDVVIFFNSIAHVIHFKTKMVNTIKFAAIMNAKDDLQSRWWKLEEKFMNKFGKKPDVEAILFLIGIQEIGKFKKKFSKEQKQDLM